VVGGRLEDDITQRAAGKGERVFSPGLVTEEPWHLCDSNCDYRDWLEEKETPADVEGDVVAKNEVDCRAEVIE